MSIGLGGALGAALVNGADQFKASEEHYQDRNEMLMRQGEADQAYQRQMQEDAAQAGMDQVGYENFAKTLSPHIQPFQNLAQTIQQTKDKIRGTAAPAPAAAPQGGLPSLPGIPGQGAPLPVPPAAAPDSINENDPSGSLSGGSPMAQQIEGMDQAYDDRGMTGPYDPTSAPLKASGQQGNYLDRSAARRVISDALGPNPVHGGKMGAAMPMPQAPNVGAQKVTIPPTPKVTPEAQPKTPSLGGGKGYDPNNPTGQDLSKVSNDASAFDLDSIQDQVGALDKHYNALTDEMRAKAQVALAVQDPTVRGRLLRNLQAQYQPQLDALEKQGQTLLDNFHVGAQREAGQRFWVAAFTGDTQAAQDYLTKNLGIDPAMAKTFQGIQPDYDKKGNQTGMSAVFRASDGTEHRIDGHLFATLADKSATPGEMIGAVKDMEKHFQDITSSVEKADTQQKIAQIRAQSAAMRASKPAAIVQQADAAYRSALKNGASEVDAETARFAILNNSPDAKEAAKEAHRTGTTTEEEGVAKDGKPYRKKITKTPVAPGAAPAAPKGGTQASF